MSKLTFRLHALRRMFERGISVSEVRAALAVSRTIMSYADDKPYATRLVLGYSGERALHVVLADNPADEQTIVATVYEPDPGRWDSGLTRRKRP
jgi:hypothetical protein